VVPCTCTQISALLDLGADPSLLPDEFSIRSLANIGAPGAGTYSLERYLRERGDRRVRTTADLVKYARFFSDDRYFDPRAGLERRLEATSMDTGPRMQLRFATQQVSQPASQPNSRLSFLPAVTAGNMMSQVVLCTMAELDLDVLVAPTNNQPPPKLGAPRPLGRDARPDVWSFLGSQGIPALSVPAGFTTHV
jgi:amidase